MAPKLSQEHSAVPVGKMGERNKEEFYGAGLEATHTASARHSSAWTESCGHS